MCPQVFECRVTRQAAAVKGALELEKGGPLVLKHAVNLQLGLLEVLVVTVLGSGADAGLELIEEVCGGG